MPCPPDPDEIERLKIDVDDRAARELHERVAGELPGLVALLDRLGSLCPGVDQARAHLAAVPDDAPPASGPGLDAERAYTDWYADRAAKRIAALCAARCALFARHPHRVNHPDDPDWERERDRHFAHRLEDLVAAQGLIRKRRAYWERLLAKEEADTARLVAMVPLPKKEALRQARIGLARRPREQLDALAAIEAAWVAMRDDPVRLLTDPDPFADPLP